MQNKGLIRLFAILFGLVSLYQLSFSFFTSKVENEAKEYAKSRGDLDNGRELAKLEKKYLDSVNNLEVINLGVSQFTYNDIKDKEMKLDSDLKKGVKETITAVVKKKKEYYSKRSVSFFLHLNNKDYLVDITTYTNVLEGDNIQLSFAPESKTIFSVNKV